MMEEMKVEKKIKTQVSEESKSIHTDRETDTERMQVVKEKRIW